MGAMVLLVVCSAFGGSLQDREQDVAERSAAKKKEPNPSQPHSDAAHSAFGSGTYPSSGDESFLASFWGWLVAAPFYYRYDDPAASMSPGGEEWDSEHRSIFPQHVQGEATVPYVRFDYNYQFVDGDQHIDTHDGRLELGYKYFAFHGRMTKYIQDDGFTLDLRQYYGVLRYGGYRPDFVPGTFEMAVGLGVVQHTGDVKDDSSGALTFPIKYHPTDWFGVEFRPAWYRWQEITIGDYDLSASLGTRFVQFRGGYRWLWDNGMVDVQSGPYVGLSGSF